MTASDPKWAERTLERLQRISSAVREHLDQDGGKWPQPALWNDVTITLYGILDDIDAEARTAIYEEAVATRRARRRKKEHYND